MARPIKPTPTLEGKEAEKVLKSVERTKLTSQQEKRLDKCAHLYDKFCSAK